jgi:hypothetical protein
VANKNIILREKQRMLNPETIVVLVYEWQEPLNIMRRIVGLRNSKVLTDGRIMATMVEQVIYNPDGRFRKNQYTMVRNRMTNKESNN